MEGGKAMKRVLVLALFLATTAVLVGFRQVGTDSLIHRWRQVEAGRLEMPDSLQARLLCAIGEGMSYDVPDSAIAYYQKALDISRKAGLEAFTGDILNRAGYAHYVLGNYDMALTFYISALEVHEQAKNDPGIAMSLNNISMIYETQKNFQQALQYQWESIVHSLRATDLARLTSNYYNLSVIHDGAQNYDSALFYLARALRLSEDTENHHLYAMALNRRGEVYLHMGRYPEAEESYKAVIEYQGYQNKWENCFAYTGLAKVSQKLGHYDESIGHGLTGLTLARQVNSKWDIVQSTRILYESYKAKKDLAHALEMHELHKQYNDSLFSEAKEKEINFLHLKQKELERAQLAKENALNKAKIRQNYLWISFFVVIVAIMAIWGVILYRNNRHKQVLNKRLTIKNQNIADRNAKIEKQNKELNELNETKNLLLSIISHDLRSPIHNIKSILEIIKNGGIKETEQKKIFNDLYKTVESVSGTMNNMLAWASRQLNGGPTQQTRFGLCEVVDNLVEFFLLRAQEKGIELVHHRDETVHAWFDVEHLKTALRNILSNAIKFTGRGGTVKVAYHVSDGVVRLEVADTGIGIDADDIGNLFTFKGRSKSLGTNNEKGTGIGLMLSREFIESNGGKIEVASKPGEGTKFTLLLPTTGTLKNEATAMVA